MGEAFVEMGFEDSAEEACEGSDTSLCPVIWKNWNGASTGGEMGEIAARLLGEADTDIVIMLLMVGLVGGYCASCARLLMGCCFCGWG